MQSSVKTDLLNWLHCGTEYSADLNKHLLTIDNSRSVQESAFRDGDFFVNLDPDFNQKKHTSNANTILMRTEMRESKLLRVYYLHVFSSGLRKWLKFEIHELEYKRTMLSSSKRIFRLNFSSEQNSKENCLLEFDSIAKLIGHYVNTQNGLVKINDYEIFLRNGMSYRELNSKLIESIQMKEKQTAPRKPIRMPTIKTNKKPDILLNKLIANSNRNNSKEDNDYELLKSIPTDGFSLGNDVNAPKLNLRSIFDLKSYECDFISNKSKKLDRLALIETHRTLLLKISAEDFQCNQCSDMVKNLAVYLAKYFTYEDLKVLQFNFDFGLGVFTGLEMITLPQGHSIRSDTIERYSSSSLFIALMIVLCQNCDDRIELLIKLIDCAVVLIDKLNNLYAFSYLIAAFNHPQVKRLNETWDFLKKTHQSKWIQLENLNSKYASLNKGDLFFCEQNSLIPNIYPIAVLMQNDLSSSIDFDQYSSLSNVYLSLNGRYLAANSSKFAARCELFIQNEHPLLSSNKSPLDYTHKCSELRHNLSHLAQTEFHQIIMWSDELKRDDNFNLKTNDINQLIQILSFKIQPSGN